MPTILYGAIDSYLTLMILHTKTPTYRSLDFRSCRVGRARLETKRTRQPPIEMLGF